ncbi:MAG: hypothetical protein ACRD24_15360 [Terriglobales bacterium]
MSKARNAVIVGAQWGDVEPLCGRERGAAEREPAGEILSEAKEPESP